MSPWLFSNGEGPNSNVPIFQSHLIASTTCKQIAVVGVKRGGVPRFNNAPRRLFSEPPPTLPQHHLVFSWLPQAFKHNLKKETSKNWLPELVRQFWRCFRKKVSKGAAKWNALLPPDCEFAGTKTNSSPIMFYCPISNFLTVLIKNLSLSKVARKLWKHSCSGPHSRRLSLLFPRMSVALHAVDRMERTARVGRTRREMRFATESR